MPITPQELITNLGNLPPLPQVATQVLRVAADPDSSTDELQRIIATDQALSVQILKVANSAMFGMMREVTTLTQAIMTLGFSTIKSIVIASSARNLYARGSGGLQERLMWEHALVAALGGRAYARSLRYPRTEEVFLAGLMHDIGKSVIALKYPDRYSTLVRAVYNKEGDGIAMELDTFGFDHTMVGEVLLRSWNIAPSIEQAARWHHDPLQTSPDLQPLVAIVALGNRLAFDQNLGIGKASSLDVASQEALQILNLDEAAFARHREGALEAVEKDKTLIAEF